MSATRKKVKLAFICNAAARKASLKKRTKGLLTKVKELSTLCGVEACMIMYRPDELQPRVWASPPGIHGILALFQSMSEASQSRHMMNQEAFLKARLSKIENQLEKQWEDTREKELTRLMFSTLTGKRLETLSLEDLEALGDFVSKYLLDIKHKTERLNNQTKGFTPEPVTGNGISMNLPRREEIVQAQQAPTFEINMDMETMNPPEQMGYNEEEAMPSIGGNNSSPIWFDDFFY